MKRRFINQFGDRETIDDVFVVSEKQLRTNRNGNLYLQLRLSDRSGSMTAMLWNANDRLYASFDNGDYLRVQGTTQLYNGTMQMILKDVERAARQEVDEADFVTLAAQQIDALTGRVGSMLRGLQHEALRNLAECFLTDEDFMNRFAAAPAGVKAHHAYRGGLLEHTVGLMELSQLVGPRYADVNDDLLLMGAFLHDIGKVVELTYDRDLGYSDAGQMIGHVVQGGELLDEKIRETEKLADEPFPDELRLRLKHMIISHQGQYEYGSPKLPMTPEAIALNLLDTLDSKLHSVSQLMREDINSESPWTTYQPNMGRKFFKGYDWDPQA